MTAQDKRNLYEALGIAVRAGVEPSNAATNLGLGDVKFTGERPVALRPAGE